MTTEVQRTWMAATDPAVKFYHQGKKDQRLTKDNELSLPLGEGVHANFEKSDANGFYRRISSDITRVKNNVITQK